MITRDLFTENFNGEYDDEAGMAKTNLVTIARAAQGLLDTIDDQENLPEWVQEKIAKVQGMMVTAWDYLESQEAQGVDPKITDEDADPNSGYAQMLKKRAELAARKKLQGVAEEKVRLDPKCWTGKKIGNPKTKVKGGVRVNNCVPAESVEEAVNPAQQAAIAIAKKKDQDVTEGSPRVDSLVTDALKIMRGSEVSDAVQALKTVLGDREYNGRRGHYNFYVRQLIDMYSQQGVAEGEKIGNMDAGAYDSAMSRLKQLAGSGPMKTVYDPSTRRYKNVPTAVQPAQQPRKK